MKIAFLSFEYPPDTGYGGIGTYTWYQARALVKLGHEVHVLAGANETTQLKQSEHDGVKVYRFRSDGLWMKGFAHLGKFRMWWTKNRLENALSMYRAFHDLEKSNHYDIVEMPECGAEGLFINRFMGIKTVVKLHSPARLIMPFYDVPHADLTFCSFLEQRGIRSAGHLTACSNFLAREAREKLDVKTAIRVIPNGIDLDLFDAGQQIDIRKKFHIPADRPIVLFSGRMENRKGIHLCKEIVTKILERHEVTFVLAGGDLFQYMQDTLLPYWKTRTLRGSVNYLGKLDQVSIRSLLREADIFLLPSLWENCPYSCLEAMAARCAIVSSDQGGMPELIQDHENGLLARAGNVDSYVSCLEELIVNTALRERLGESARRRISQSFTDVQIARSSADYYQTCLGNKVEKTSEDFASVPPVGKT